MAIVADRVYSGTEASLNDIANQVHEQRENKHKPAAALPASRIHHSNWRPWAFAGAAAVVLAAAASIAVVNNAGRPDEHLARVMGYAKPPGRAVSQQLSSIPNQPINQAPSATAAKSVTTTQNSARAVDRYTSAASPEAPMIARTASLTILVQDFAAARNSLDAFLARYGGYSANLAIDTPENGQRRFQASLRIPANQLDSALADLKKLGRGLNESQSGQEVTQQHADLAARLQNSRETELRLRDVLAQRTGKIGDVLQVEQEIAWVRGEIETMESEQKALEHRVAFAGVDLQLVEEYNERLNPSPVSTVSRLRNAFVEGIRSASGTLLGLILFLEEFAPSILIWATLLGLPAYFVWRRHKRVSVE